MKDTFKKFFRKLRYSHRGIPDKKVYIEFVTALLSIPVMLTVVMLNINNLKGVKNNDKPVPTTTEKVIYVTQAPETKQTPSVVTVTVEACKKSLAPIDISSPDDGEVVSSNPVNVSINYDQGQYCSAVWSYRINGGQWSDYDDKSIALYNLPSGTITFELRVKSLATSETKLLKRTFTYKGNTNTPQASASAQ